MATSGGFLLCLSPGSSNSLACSALRKEMEKNRFSLKRFKKLQQIPALLLVQWWQYRAIGLRCSAGSIFMTTIQISPAQCLKQKAVIALGAKANFHRIKFTTADHKFVGPIFAIFGITRAFFRQQ